MVLQVIFAWVPILLLAWALFFADRYPLTPEIHARLDQLLAARRAGALETKVTAEEAEDLRERLIGSS